MAVIIWCYIIHSFVHERMIKTFGYRKYLRSSYCCLNIVNVSLRLNGARLLTNRPRVIQVTFEDFEVSGVVANIRFANNSLILPIDRVFTEKEQKFRRMIVYFYGEIPYAIEDTRHFLFLPTTRLARFIAQISPPFLYFFFSPGRYEQDTTK